MKILFVSSWYPTETNPNFGVFVKEHAKAIKSANDEIIVLAIVVHRSKDIWNCSVSDFYDENNIRTVLIEIHSRYRDLIYHALPLQYFLINKIYKKRIKKDFEIDIVHSSVIFPAGILGYYLSKKIKKPHIITEHWTKVRQFSTQKLFSPFGKKAYSRAERILPVSYYLQKEISESFGISNDKFTVVGNVIDSNVFSYKIKTPIKNRLKFCAIATWSTFKQSAKQPELLINAVALFQKKMQVDVELIMIGGGDKVDNLKKMCVENNVNASFTGFIPKNQIADYLNYSDFFVHPTLVETFGVVIVEALLTGTPVICSDLEVLRDHINDSNGILCENTVDDWAAAFCLALQKNFDNEQIAKKVKDKYSYQSIGNQINAVYNSI